MPLSFLQSSFDINGMFGGATVGYNWQSGPAVLGVEGDFSESGITGSSDCFQSFGLGPAMGIFGLGSTCKTDMEWFATATGRLGLTHDHALLYIKGGAAWARFEHDATDGPTMLGFGAASIAGSISNTPVGFTFGTGLRAVGQLVG
jgi:outer membrane immunogenic protein